MRFAARCFFGAFVAAAAATGWRQLHLAPEGELALDASTLTHFDMNQNSNVAMTGWQALASSCAAASFTLSCFTGLPLSLQVDLLKQGKLAELDLTNLQVRAVETKGDLDIGVMDRQTARSLADSLPTALDRTVVHSAKSTTTNIKTLADLRDPWRYGRGCAVCTGVAHEDDAMSVYHEDEGVPGGYKTNQPARG